MILLVSILGHHMEPNSGRPLSKRSSRETSYQNLGISLNKKLKPLKIAGPPGARSTSKNTTINIPLRIARASTTSPPISKAQKANRRGVELMRARSRGKSLGLRRRRFRGSRRNWLRTTGTIRCWGRTHWSQVWVRLLRSGPRNRRGRGRLVLIQVYLEAWRIRKMLRGSKSLKFSWILTRNCLKTNFLICLKTGTWMLQIPNRITIYALAIRNRTMSILVKRVVVGELKEASWNRSMRIWTSSRTWIWQVTWSKV